MNLTFGPNWIILKCTEKNASLKLAWSSRPCSRTHFARTPARYVDSVCERVTPTDPLVYTSVRRLFLQHQRKWQQAKQQLCWQVLLIRLLFLSTTSSEPTTSAITSTATISTLTTTTKTKMTTTTTKTLLKIYLFVQPCWKVLLICTTFVHEPIGVVVDWKTNMHTTNKQHDNNIFFISSQFNNMQKYTNVTTTWNSYKY